MHKHFRFRPEKNSPKAEFSHSDPFDLVEQHIHLPKHPHVRVPVFQGFESPLYWKNGARKRFNAYILLTASRT